MDKATLIDVDRMVIVKVCSTVERADHWADLLCKGRETVVLDHTSGKHWSSFTLLELRHLYINSIPGVLSPETSYAKLWQGLRDYVETLPVDCAPAPRTKPAPAKAFKDLPPPSEPRTVAPARTEHNHHQEDQTVSETKNTKPAPKAATKAAPAAPAAKPATKAKPEPKPKAERIVQNGVTRPTAGTEGDKIFTAADKLSKTKRRACTKDELLEFMKDSGVNENSIRTGYGHWRKFNGMASLREEKKAATANSKAA